MIPEELDFLPAAHPILCAQLFDAFENGKIADFPTLLTLLSHGIRESGHKNSEQHVRHLAQWVLSNDAQTVHTGLGEALVTGHSMAKIAPYVPEPESIEEGAERGSVVDQLRGMVEDVFRQSSAGPKGP